MFREEGGPTLVAAIEIISPGNKDRSATRSSFVAKCASFLSGGVGLVIVDVVTTRTANLHNELIQFLRGPEEAAIAPAVPIYAAGYRLCRRGSNSGSTSGGRR